MPVLLEREAQLAELQQHATAAFEDRSGRVVLLGGVAGSGKTSLVGAFSRTLPTATVRLTGVCEPISAPRPLGPLLDFARRLGEGFAELVAQRADRQVIFAELLEALRSTPLPQLLVLEDLHWADDATLDLLRFCGRRLSGSRVLLLGTYRPDELGTRHPLRRVLGDLASAEAVHRLLVPELTAQGVAALSRGRDVDPQALFRRTGGNPFFVTEVLATGGDQLPVTVEDAVLARVSRLPNRARQVIELAAVIGPAQDVHLLERLTGDTSGIDECVAHGMLVGNGPKVAFRHDIAREAVLGSMSAGRLRRYHEAVLLVLENGALPGFATGPGEPYAAEGVGLATLAHHAAGAGDAQRTYEYALAAGRAALQLRAYREAKVQFGRVLALPGRVTGEERAELLQDYASACAASSDDPGSARALAESLTLLRRGSHTGKTARALMRYAGVLSVLGNVDDAERCRQEALGLVGKVDDGADRAWVYHFYAYALMLDRRNDEARDWARRAVASGKRAGDHRVVASAYNVLVGVMTIKERIGEARRYHRAGLTLINEGHGMDRTTATASMKSMLGSGLGEVYRLREAEAALAEASDLAAAVDLDSVHHYALAWRALVHLYLGRWSEAGELATWLLGIANLSLPTRVMAGAALGRLRLRRGDPEVWPVLDEALADALSTDTLQRLAPVRAARAEAALAAGDLDVAASEALAALPLALEHRHRWFVGELVYLARRAGSRVELPDWVEGPFAMQVRAEHRRAAGAWRRLGCRFEEARALADSGEVEHLWRAHAIFRELGAKPAAGRVADELRRAGVRKVPGEPRRSTRANPAGLTQREAQVLQLLAAGLRNSEIALRHGVSERTVGHQVSAVLAKLESTTRTQAVNEARRRGLI